MISQLNLSLGETSVNARFNFDVLERHNLLLLFPDPSKAASLVAALFLFELKGFGPDMGFSGSGNSSIRISPSSIFVSSSISSSSTSIR